MEVTEDEVRWTAYACSRRHVRALCDLGPATASKCDGRSPSSFVVADRCVDVITDVTTYFEARALCRRRGSVADLVQLKTETDNAQAAAALRTYLNSTDQQTPNAFWIGLVRSHWSWAGVDVELTYTNWAENTPSAPTTAAQQCAILSRDVSGRWKNVPCNWTKPFVCEDVNRTVRTTVRTTTTTKTTMMSGRTMSSLSPVSLGATTSFQSSPVSAADTSSSPLSTGVLIAIACGGFVFLVAVVIFAVVIPVVVCRRKRGRQSAVESGSKNEDVLESPTDLKPHYYFGVTVDDLRHADDEPSSGDNHVTYATLTTPPPDVVPHTGFTDQQPSSAAFSYTGDPGMHPSDIDQPTETH